MKTESKIQADSFDMDTGVFLWLVIVATLVAIISMGNYDSSFLLRN